MAGEHGIIVQKGQAVGIKKALAKMVDLMVSEGKNLEQKKLYISHCNCPDRAEYVKNLVLAKYHPIQIEILDTAGISSMYSNDGGIIAVI